MRIHKRHFLKKATASLILGSVILLTGCNDDSGGEEGSVSVSGQTWIGIFDSYLPGESDRIAFNSNGSLNIAVYDGSSTTGTYTQSGNTVTMKWDGLTVIANVSGGTMSGNWSDDLGFDSGTFVATKQ